MSKEGTKRQAELVRICGTLAGWRVDDKPRRHWVVYPPRPHAMITISKTPSDPGRAFLNARADVNRVLRALGQPEVMK